MSWTALSLDRWTKLSLHSISTGRHCPDIVQLYFTSHSKRWLHNNCHKQESSTYISRRPQYRSVRHNPGHFWRVTFLILTVITKNRNHNLNNRQLQLLILNYVLYDTSYTVIHQPTTAQIHTWRYVTMMQSWWKRKTMLHCRSHNEKLTEDCRVIELQSFPSSVLHHVNAIFFRQRRSIPKQLGALRNIFFILHNIVVRERITKIPKHF